MTFCLVAVYVMDNIFRYIPNLKIEENSKNSGRWISIRYLKKS